VDAAIIADRVIQITFGGAPWHIGFLWLVTRFPI